MMSKLEEIINELRKCDGVFEPERGEYEDCALVIEYPSGIRFGGKQLMISLGFRTELSADNAIQRIGKEKFDNLRELLDNNFRLV
jgi:hypothetical protein